MEYTLTCLANFYCLKDTKCPFVTVLFYSIFIREILLFTEQLLLSHTRRKKFQSIIGKGNNSRTTSYKL